MRSKELDPKANPFLQGIDFTAVDSDTIRAVTETPNMDITLNLSSPQLLIHNTAEKYTYESIETADYTGMYRIVEFEPAQRMVFEKMRTIGGQNLKFKESYTNRLAMQMPVLSPH